jgi:Ca2+-binding EF-hand superfamily protein
MISSIAGSLASSWTASLFAKLDTANSGYIDTAALTEALTQTSSPGSSDSASATQSLVAALDGNGDAKLTQQEMAAALQKLLEEVGSLLGNAGGTERSGGRPPAGGMPPPPPPEGADGTGFTKDELQAMVDSSSGTDDQRTALMTRIIGNFDAADTDGDGKVSFAEARAFGQSTEAAQGPSTGTAQATTATADDGATVLANILQLLLAYGGLEDTTAKQATSFATTA